MIAQKHPPASLHDTVGVENRPAQTMHDDREDRLMLDVLDEAEAKLTALERAIGVMTAHLIYIVDCYRHDLEQIRSEVRSAEDRLECLYKVSEQMYKLCKQIDSFTKTGLKLKSQREQTPAGHQQPGHPAGRNE